MIPVPRLETERLLLVPISIADIPSYQKNFANYEVIRHLSALVPWPYPENGVRNFFENVSLPRQGIDRWSWGIRLRSEPDEVVGCVDLWRPGTPENRGFWLAKQHWGKGLMTEAVTPVMDFAFGAADFETLVFANAVGNERSRRVKEKTGARLVDVRPAKFVDPTYTEHEIWELGKNAWTSFRASRRPAQELTTNRGSKTMATLKILNPASLPSNPGPSSYFTGMVQVTPLVQGEEPSCLACASVAFEPGARSAWHTHPRGQLLIVTDGSGLIQQWGEPVQRIQKGDVIWTPPGVKHWHGASAATAMTHTAIQESLNGKMVDWMEK